MGYVVKTYSDLQGLSQAFVDALSELGVTPTANVVGTSGGQPDRRVILQMDSKFYVQYHFRMFEYNSRYDRFRPALFTQFGDTVTNNALTGNVSSNVGDRSSSSNVSSDGQGIPFPGKLHMAKNDSGNDLVFALENPTDSNTRLHVVSHTTFSDSSYGAAKQWFTDGYYAGYTPYRKWATPAFYNGDISGVEMAGLIQHRDAAGNVVGVWYMGNGHLGGNRPCNGFNILGGTYNSIWKDLAYDRSLTSIFLPMIWMADQPGENSRYTRAPRSEHPLIRLCKMKHLGVGQQITYNSKKWRVFPINGKGGTDTPGIAFLEG